MSFEYGRGGSSGMAIPATRQLAVSGSGNNTWLKGAPLILSAGKLVEAGANPTNIGAIALHDVGPGTGRLYPLGVKEFPPGYGLFTQLEDFHVFYANYIGTLPSVVGGTFGITKDTDNRWKVDFTKSASNQRVTLVDLSPTTTPGGAGGTTLMQKVGVYFNVNLTIDRI